MSSCSGTDSFVKVLSMQRNLLRIPCTGPLPTPIIIPQRAESSRGATTVLSDFLLAPDRVSLPSAHQSASKSRTVLLTGAGISVASGLADYRGSAGTYTLNKTYRPVYYGEFITNHEARKRYWARSFLGWTHLQKAKPNAAHLAVKDLADLGYVSSVITQSASMMVRIVPGFSLVALYEHVLWLIDAWL